MSRRTASTAMASTFLHTTWKERVMNFVRTRIGRTLTSGLLVAAICTAGSSAGAHVIADGTNQPDNWYWPSSRPA